MARISVIDKRTGKRGTVSEQFLDPNKFEVVESTQTPGISTSSVDSANNPSVLKRLGRFAMDVVDPVQKGVRSLAGQTIAGVGATGELARRGINAAGGNLPGTVSNAITDLGLSITPEATREALTANNMQGDLAGIARESAKSGLAIGSAVGPGGPVAKTAGRRVLQQAGRGAIESAADSIARGQALPEVAGSAVIGAATGGFFQGVSDVIPSVKGKLLKRGGEQLEEFGKGQALKGIKPSPSQQKLFKDRTGIDMGDFALSKNLVDATEESVTNLISPLQEQFDLNTINSNKRISLQEALQPLQEEIAARSTKTARVIDGNKQIADHLADKVEDIRLLADGEGTIALADLVEIRKGVDRITPKSDFGVNPVEAGKPRVFGDILRNIQSTHAGTADLGKELSQLYLFRDIVSKQAGKGKGSQFMNLTKLLSAGAGGTVGGIPGAVATIAGTEILNTPAGVRTISNTARGAGQAAQRLGQTIAESSSPISNITGSQPVQRGVAKSMSTALNQEPIPTIAPELEEPTATGANNNLELERKLQTLMLIDPDNADMYKGIMKSRGITPTDSKMTESERKFSAASQMADNIIDDITTGGVQTGPLAAAGTAVGEKLGRADARTKLKADLSLLNTAVKNALLGASMSTQEMASIISAIPEVTDQEEVIKAKLEALKNNLSILSAPAGVSVKSIGN